MTTYPPYIDEDGDGYGDSQKIPVPTACFNPDVYDECKIYGDDCWDVPTSNPSHKYALNTFPVGSILDDASDCMLDWDGDYYGDDTPSIQTYLQEQTVRMI